MEVQSEKEGQTMTTTFGAPESIWYERLKYAQLQLDFARAYLKEVEQDLKSGCLPDGEFAHRSAIEAEKLALQKVAGLRKIFNALVLHGKIPDEQPRELRR